MSAPQEWPLRFHLPLVACPDFSRLSRSPTTSPLNFPCESWLTQVGGSASPSPCTVPPRRGVLALESPNSTLSHLSKWCPAGPILAAPSPLEGRVGAVGFPARSAPPAGSSPAGPRLATRQKHSHPLWMRNAKRSRRLTPGPFRFLPAAAPTLSLPPPPTPPAASARPRLRSKLVGHWASVSRWARRAAGLGPPWAALLVGEARRAKGRLTRSRRREGHRGVWVVDGWAEFLNLSLFLKKKAPILCHHFYGICNSGKNLSLI